MTNNEIQTEMMACIAAAMILTNGPKHVKISFKRSGASGEDDDMAGFFLFFSSHENPERKRRNAGFRILD